MQQGFHSLLLSFRPTEHLFYLLIFIHCKTCIECMLGCDNILSKRKTDFKIL